MARPLPTASSNMPRFVVVASVCVVVAALYFAQDVLIPLALAMLLTFLLSPLVQRLERFGLHRVPSVIIVAVLTFGALGLLGWVVANQVLELARDLPVYKDNIKTKLHWLPRPADGGVIGRLKQTVKEVNQEMAPASTQPTRPLPVRLVPPDPTAWDILRDNAGKVAGPLATAGIVAIFVVFMLLAREDLRNRLIRLVGYGQLTVTTEALDDATSRISRYLLAQAMVNGTYGTAIAIGLWLIGMTFGHDDPPFPNVILFGLLCGVLRFIPYIGAWISAAFPLALALAIYKGFGVFVAVVVMFVIIELLTYNVAEPMLYGASTGMSTIAILVSAVFWTWLWGPIGLLLATPLTVCLVVLGKYVPQLKFLDILLGDEPVLAPPERLYQRWLALDQEEAAELVHEFFTQRSLEAVYDEILIPALALAEQDRHNGRLDDRRQAMIRQSLRELIEELGDEHRLRFAQTGAGTSDAPGKSDDGQGDSTPAPPEPKTARATLPKDCAVNILILPAHDEADEIVGLMLAQVLEFNNYRAGNASQATLAGEMLEMVESKEADVVAVSALPPSAVTHSRYLCKRLRQRYPDMKMLIGLWTFRGDLKRAKERIACDENARLATTLAAAINELEQVTQPILGERSSKSEFRNPKQIQNSKSEI